MRSSRRIGAGEAGADSDVLEHFFVVVETEKKGTDLFPGSVFVPAESSDDAVAVALVFDFEHDALVGLVGKVDGLGDERHRGPRLRIF